MTTVRLDAATLDKLRAGGGPLYITDERGVPLFKCAVEPFEVPDREPDLTPEEWERRVNEPGGMTTAQVLEYLRGLPLE